MARRFALTISTKVHQPPDGAPTRSGLGSRIRSAALGFIVLVVAAAALFVGSHGAWNFHPRSENSIER
jgi:hypothetical protein